MKVLFSLLLTVCFIFASNTPLSDKGCEYLNKKDFLKAKKIFEEAASKGEALAMNNLGLMYINGDGVKQNYPIAMLYFQQALEHGYTNAAYDLGAMYRNAEGVQKNMQKAKEYYLIAAKTNYALAQFELAKIYAQEQNMKEFQHWALEALKHGYQPRTENDRQIIAYLKTHSQL